MLTDSRPSVQPLPFNVKAKELRKRSLDHQEMDSLPPSKHFRQQEKQTLYERFTSFPYEFPLIKKSVSALVKLWTCLKGTVLNWMTEQRGIFVVFFLLPLSFVFDIAWGLKSFYENYLLGGNSSLAYHKRVHKVQEQVKTARQLGHNKLCTARPGWLAMSFREGLYKKSWAKIDLSDLNHVLKIDTDKQLVKCEPLCSMGQLSHFLTRRGWTLAVTPELDDLTVGGLINGFGIETSSHRYGLFQHICEAFEVVLPDGTFVRATKDENSDLFYALPWSHGTLGFLVSAEIKIIPCAPLVELSYFPCHSQKEYSDAFKKASFESHDFVEGLVYSHDTAVIMTGRMVPYSTMLRSPTRFNPIGLWWKPWFYQHVESFLSLPNQGPIVEYIPLRDYYHRHTKAIFWELKDIIPFADNWLFRVFLGWLMPVRVSLLKLTQTEAIRHLYSTKHVMQDMLIPMKKLPESMNLMEKEFAFFPIWLCPMLLPGVDRDSNASKGLVHAKDEPGSKADGKMIPSQMFVDIGVYGSPRIPDFDAREALTRVESFVLKEAKGFQALYADSLLSRKDFHHMFDHRLYNQVRQKYQMDESFPEVYDKVNLSARR